MLARATDLLAGASLPFLPGIGSSISLCPESAFGPPFEAAAGCFTFLVTSHATRIRVLFLIASFNPRFPRLRAAGLSKVAGSELCAEVGDGMKG